MSIKERRDVEKAVLKKKIMDAAMDIIDQEGYTNLSIRKIAVKIDYSPTTIYLYYKDKAQIITDMAEAFYNKIIDKSKIIINQGTSVSAEKKVHDIMCCMIRTFTDEPEMAKTIIYNGMNDIFVSEEKDPNPTNPGIKELDELIAQGIAENSFNPRAKNASWMIISALIGFAINVVENKLYLQTHYDQTVDTFVEILMGGIRK